MELDERARARLRALADGGDGELGEAAHGRIARRVAEQGPRVLRRARRARTARQLGTGALALGLAGMAALALDTRIAPSERSRRAPPTSEPQQLAAARPDARACERRTFAATEALGAGGARRFVLGELGSAIAAQGSAVSLDASDRCRVIVRLTKGRVDVYAADLGGGELRVVTASGEVSVHGTVFSVALQDSALIVDVDEGRVSVRRPDGDEAAIVDAGRRLRVTRESALASEPLPDDDRARLRAALGLGTPAARLTVVQGSEEGAAIATDGARDAPAADAQPGEAAPASEAAARVNAHGADDGARSAESLVTEADGLWRAGQLERARERYRRAGALDGITAEAAWLALARRELSAARPAAARAALQSYRARFPRGKLAGEALGIEFRAALQQDDVRAARRVAQQLQQRHPGTPQADAAARWAAGQPPRDRE